jgi:hypothetical protein
MELWQAALIFALAIPAGIAAGVFYSYLHFRVAYKTRVSLKAIGRVLFSVIHEMRKKQALPSAMAARHTSDMEHSIVLAGTLERASQPLATRDSMAMIRPARDRSRETMAVLMAEFEHNRTIIRRFSGDELKPLRTSSWDENQHIVNGLAADLQDELGGIYGDINLLNHLVWLSSEYNRKSPSIREHYLTLGMSIADRLDSLVSGSVLPFGRVEPESAVPTVAS